MFSAKNVSFLLITFWAGTQTVQAAVRVAFLPFESKVKLNNSWVLSNDVPRWFSQTVDTIGFNDSAVSVVSYDIVLAAIKQSGWKRAEYLTPKGLTRLSSGLGVDVVVTGTINRFKIMKQSINTDAPLNTSQDISKSTYGQGGVTVMGGLQSFEADVGIDIEMFGAQGGGRIGRLVLDTREKDAGFKMWLPFQVDNPEMNYYYTSENPFGSVYFKRSVAGVVMHRFSQKIQEDLSAKAPGPAPAAAITRTYLEGKILERDGKDVYIDLGSADQIMQGEVLEVLRPERPVLNAAGDTLGWVEKPAGSIRVRFVKAVHFSLAGIEEEADSILAGWTVRARDGVSTSQAGVIRGHK